MPGKSIATDGGGRRDLCKKALDECRKLIQQYPDFLPLQSVANQLQYLVELLEGEREDRQLLNTINLGLIAAREIEDIDMALADLLHEVSAEVELMKQYK